MILNFDNVKHARLFLGNLQVKGMGKITFVTLEGGSQLNFKDMDDSQAVHYAKELYELYRRARHE